MSKFEEIQAAIGTLSLAEQEELRAWLEELAGQRFDAAHASNLLPAFASVQDGVREAVARMMPPDGEDLEWVRPYLDEARASVARGEVFEAEDVFAAMDQQLKSRGA